MCSHKLPFNSYKNSSESERNPQSDPLDGGLLCVRTCISYSAGSHGSCGKQVVLQFVNRGKHHAVDLDMPDRQYGGLKGLKQTQSDYIVVIERVNCIATMHWMNWLGQLSFARWRCKFKRTTCSKRQNHYRAAPLSKRLVWRLCPAVHSLYDKKKLAAPVAVNTQKFLNTLSRQRAVCGLRVFTFI